MRGVLRRNVLGALIAEFVHVETGKKLFTGAQQRRSNREVHFIDKAGTEILLYRGDSTAEPNVFPVGGFGRPLEDGVNAIGDEVEDRAAIHDHRVARMVRQNKNGRVVRRIISPPASPAFVGPGSPNRPEHVAAHDPGPDVTEASRRKIVVDAGRAAFTSEHLLERTGGEGPFVQRNAANTEGIVDILLGPCPVAINGYGETVDAELGLG